MCVCVPLFFSLGIGEFFSSTSLHIHPYIHTYTHTNADTHTRARALCGAQCAVCSVLIIFMVMTVVVEEWSYLTFSCCLSNRQGCHDAHSEVGCIA